MQERMQREAAVRIKEKQAQMELSKSLHAQLRSAEGSSALRDGAAQATAASSSSRSRVDELLSAIPPAEFMEAVRAARLKEEASVQELSA
jgi:hypothetical protein